MSGREERAAGVSEGDYSVTVRALDRRAPELDVAAWSQLGGPNDERPLLYRSILLAQAEALENQIFVASLWKRDGALGGLAIAIQSADPQRRALIVGIPNSLRSRHPTGLWVAPTSDARRVARDLLLSLRRFAGQLGISRLVVGFCPSDGDQGGSALDAGLAAIVAQPQYELLLPAGGYTAYLSALTKKRRQNVLWDLRRCERSGASCTVEASPAHDLLERAWQLQLETYTRNRVRTYRWRANLFSSLRRTLSASSFSMILCRRESSLLGFILYHPTDSQTMAVYSGHVMQADFPVHMALVASLVRAEAGRGPSLLLLGPTNDVLKRRIGATELPHVHYYAAS